MAAAPTLLGGQYKKRGPSRAGGSGRTRLPVLEWAEPPGRQALAGRFEAPITGNSCERQTELSTPRAASSKACSGAVLQETDQGPEESGNRDSRERKDAVLNRPPPLP